ncbi:Txe/YoeB family addiction module toxin [Alphaproteobacteria bacterium]|nr:Txe/YoeB family addiction module toxin [Alphaproteobacteria bacterium]
MNLVLSSTFKEHFKYWKKNDKRIIEKISRLVEDIVRNPFCGIEKLEPLQYEFSGCWSRRINKYHRIIYKVTDDEIEFMSCRLHYE